MQRTTLLLRATLLLGPAVVLATVSGCADNGDDVAAEVAATTSVGQGAPADAVPTSTTNQETTTVAPTTQTAASNSTEFVNPFSDVEIASRLLLDAEEYAPGWQEMEFKHYLLDQELAATVPECASFVESVFEADDVPNTTDRQYFHAPEGRKAAMGQFVIVFPSEEIAQTTFDAMDDPAFTACGNAYRDASFENTGLYCCDPDVVAVPGIMGVPIETDETMHSDDIAFRSDVQYWEDASGIVHGPEVIDLVTVRVGRTISIMETISVDEFGQPFVSSDEFHRAIGIIVDRARHALAGVVH